MGSQYVSTHKIDAERTTYTSVWIDIAVVIADEIQALAEGSIDVALASAVRASSLGAVDFSIAEALAEASYGV
jgi:hypothetical protein